MCFFAGGGMQAGRNDLDLLLHALLPQRLPHEKFRHSAAHNVAEANEKKRSCRRRDESLIPGADSEHVAEPQISIDPASLRSKAQFDAAVLQPGIWQNLPPDQPEVQGAV